MPRFDIALRVNSVNDILYQTFKIVSDEEHICYRVKFITAIYLRGNRAVSVWI